MRLVLRGTRIQMNLNDYLEPAIKVAEDCGDILAERQYNFSSLQKMDKSPSTIYDQLASMKIKMFLEEHTPFSVYTEEEDDPEKRFQKAYENTLLD